MHEDPIVAEIRKFRAEHAEKYGHDLDRICNALREQQAKSKRKVVTRSPRLLLKQTGSSSGDSSGGSLPNWHGHEKK
jgi:hypothetical protein